jgi:hypothetical protein
MQQYHTIIIVAVLLAICSDAYGENFNREPRSTSGIRKNIVVLDGKSIVRLGTLYDGASDSLMTPLNLWNDSTIQANKIRQDTITSTHTSSTTETLLDRMNLLDIDASLALSFMGGLVKVSGSAKYLHNAQLTDNYVRVTLDYKSTLFSELLPFEVGKDNIHLCETKQATHVVTEITYGLNAYFLFEKSVYSKEEKKTVSGQLKAVVQAVPSFSIDAEITATLNEEETKVKNSMSLTFYGTTLLDESPTTFDQAVKVFQSMPSLAKASNSAVAFTLTPIRYYCTGKEALLNSISNNNVNKVTDMQVDFETVKRIINTHLKSIVADNYPGYNKILTNLLNDYTLFQTDINSRITKVLPTIRGGGASEQELADIIADYIDSVYEIGHMKNLLRVRQKEIETIEHIISRNTASDIVIDDGHTGKGPECMLKNEIIIIYKLRVLPLKTLAEDYQSTPAGQWDERRKWFYNSSELGRAGKVYREFVKFYNSNTGSSKHCFLIKLEVEKEGKKPVELQGLIDGETITDDFKPPGRVTELLEHSGGFQDIYMTVKHPSNIFVTHIETKIWNFNKLETEAQATSKLTPIMPHSLDRTKVHLNGLEPSTHYRVTFYLVTKFGKGPQSETFRVQTHSSETCESIIFSKGLSPQF